MASRGGGLRAMIKKEDIVIQGVRLLSDPGPQTPKERLLHLGAEGLTDAELLAVLLRLGESTAAKALDLAHRLLNDYGGLAGLRDSSYNLRFEPSDDGTETVNVLAAFEIACRVAEAELPERNLLNCPDDVVRFLYLRYRNMDQELLGAVYLDAKNRLISEAEIYRGTLHKVTVEPRQIFKRALLRSASGIILWHTHPSGDPTPSDGDLKFTHRMVKIGELMGVRIVDHLILGHPQRWVSISRRHNLLDTMRETPYG